MNMNFEIFIAFIFYLFIIFNTYTRTMANENFRIFFLVISVLGFICCLDRADYNVALGVFGFVMWK